MTEKVKTTEERLADHKEYTAQQRESYDDNPLTAALRLTQTIREWNPGGWQVVKNHPRLIEGAECFKPTVNELELPDGKKIIFDNLHLDEHGTVIEGDYRIVKPKQDGEGEDTFKVTNGDRSDFYFNDQYIDYHTGSPGSDIATQKLFDAMEVFPEAAEAYREAQQQAREQEVQGHREEVMGRLAGITDF